MSTYLGRLHLPTLAIGIRGKTVLAGFAILMAMLMVAGKTSAATERTQTIALTAGWNAVWLEVEPAVNAVATVFDSEKVDVVARYFTPATQVRFIEDPGEQAWNAPGWGVWYAPSRAEAFLTSLYAIQGSCAYLVHAKKDATINVTGTVRFRPLRWNTDSYNLVGLPVSDAVKPTFGRFFSGAGGKVGTQVYHLVQGSWQKVSNLAATEIRAGEAYWIFCEGKTNYQGPLDLRFTGQDGLTFGNGSHQTVIELTNRATNAFSVNVSIESGGDLPLFRSIPDLANLTSKSAPLDTVTDLGSLSAGGVAQFRLELRPALMAGSSGSAVLKFSTSDGIVLRVPVRATLK